VVLYSTVRTVYIIPGDKNSASFTANHLYIVPDQIYRFLLYSRD